MYTNASAATPMLSRKRKNIHPPSMQQHVQQQQSSEPSEGSPWQAMKRLRVVEDRVGHTQSDSSMNIPWLHQRTVMDPTTNYMQSNTARPNVEEEDGPHHRQYAGQNTTSEHSTSNGTITTTMRCDPAARDYHTVNHILGCLHLERIQREQQQQQKEQCRSYESSSYLVSQHQQSTFQSSDQNVHSMQTKPTRLTMKHLQTSSKLG